METTGISCTFCLNISPKQSRVPATRILGPPSLLPSKIRFDFHNLSKCLAIRNDPKGTINGFRLADERHLHLLHLYDRRCVESWRAKPRCITPTVSCQVQTGRASRSLTIMCNSRKSSICFPRIMFFNAMDRCPTVQDDLLFDVQSS